MGKKTLYDGINIPRGDEFDIDLADYHFADEGETYKQFHSIMRDRRYTVGETNVAYRVINHWEEKDLLPDGYKETSGWRKFTLVEIVWLRAINCLRAYGVSLEKIAAIKNQVMVWKPKRNSYYTFEYFVMKAATTSADMYLIVLPDGCASVASTAQIENYKLLLGAPTSMLLVSLKGIFLEMGYDVPNPEFLFSHPRGEKDAVLAVRSGTNKKVNVSMKDGRVAELETVQTYSEKGTESANKSMRKDGAYGEVITKFEKGKVQSAEVRKRKRLS